MNLDTLAVSESILDLGKAVVDLSYIVGALGVLTIGLLVWNLCLTQRLNKLIK